MPLIPQNASGSDTLRSQGWIATTSRYASDQVLLRTSSTSKEQTCHNLLILQCIMSWIRWLSGRSGSAGQSCCSMKCCLFSSTKGNLIHSQHTIQNAQALSKTFTSIFTTYCLKRYSGAKLTAFCFLYLEYRLAGTQKMMRAASSLSRHASQSRMPFPLKG